MHFKTVHTCVRTRMCVSVNASKHTHHNMTLPGTEPYKYTSLFPLYRHPEHTERPTAADVLGNFCKSERVILAWRTEDPVPQLSRTLGAPLSEGETLHRDLQNKYKDSLVKQ